MALFTLFGKTVFKASKGVLNLFGTPAKNTVSKVAPVVSGGGSGASGGSRILNGIKNNALPFIAGAGVVGALAGRGEQNDNQSDNDSQPTFTMGDLNYDASSYNDNSMVVCGDGNTVTGGVLDAVHTPSLGLSPAYSASQGQTGSEGGLLSSMDSKTMLMLAGIVGGCFVLGKAFGNNDKRSY